MIKNIFLLVFISVLILSCGKKGDPVYENPKKKAAVQSIFLNRA